MSDQDRIPRIMEGLVRMSDPIIRPINATDSRAAMTELLHAAYAQLGAMGFNYTAVDQTEEVTHKRIARGNCLVAIDADGTLVGTIMLHAPGHSSGCPWYERPEVASIGQFGVLPNRQTGGSVLACSEKRNG
jgi:hypothetical protein